MTYLLTLCSYKSKLNSIKIRNGTKLVLCHDEYGGAQVEFLGNDLRRVILEAVPSSAIHSTTLEQKTVALLNFKPSPDVLTVLVPLNPTAFSSNSPTNEVLADGIIIDGKVQVITRRPYVEWNASGSLQQISVLGIPGTEYNVEFSTNLLTDVWEVTTNFVLGAEELQTDIQLPVSTEKLYFIRIKEKPIE